MNIGYVKIRKKKELSEGNTIKNYFENFRIDIKSLLNIVEQDKYNQSIFYLNNLKLESKTKLINNLMNEKIDCILIEGENKIEYPTLDGRYTMKAMIPELAEYCYKVMKPELDEIYVCTEVFSFENVNIIEDLTKRVKVVNIVTNHRRFRNLEKRLEERDIFITVSGNKRLSLKKAKIVVNLDLSDFSIYNINRDMVIIDVTGKMQTPKSFNGIIIRKVSVNTKKVLRVFSEYEGFNKQDIIEAELAKINDYNKAREYIAFGKIYVDQVLDQNPINIEEFSRIRKKLSKRK